MKKNLLFLITALFLLGNSRSVFAEYVLPYPSYMPGNKLYVVSRVIDEVKKYWYWGSIGRVKYHLMLADKYLLEAKTLFEYKQYLLAVDALKRSDDEFRQIPQFLARAKQEGKDVSSLDKTVKESAQTHTVAIEKLKQVLPEEFIWTPEKIAPTKLPIHQLLEQAMRIRQK